MLLAGMRARHEWTRRQRDTFFAVTRPVGWLKLREVADAPAELISYVRATDDAGPRPSEYDVHRVEDPELLRRLLARVLEVDVVVKKERALWLHGHTRIHLDRVDGLGDFLELETVVDGISYEKAHAEAEAMIERLGLSRGDFLSVPYRDLLSADE